MSKIDKMKKALERLTVPVAERSDMETFITEYTENVLHKGKSFGILLHLRRCIPSESYNLSYHLMLFLFYCFVL